MAICKIEKNRHHVTMSINHQWNMNLSNEARGLFSTVFQLRENWDCTVLGLGSISKDCTDSINEKLKALERCGYLVRRRIPDKKGCMIHFEYNFYEFSQQSTPYPKIPYTDSPYLDSPTNRNIDITDFKKF